MTIAELPRAMSPLVEPTTLDGNMLDHPNSPGSIGPFEAEPPPEEHFHDLGDPLKTLAIEVADHLAPWSRNLQLPQLSAADLDRLVRRETGASARQIFAELSPSPIRRDRYTQTHRARLSDGRAVDVKLVIPHISMDASEQVRQARGDAGFKKLRLQRRGPIDRDLLNRCAQNLRRKTDLRHEAADLIALGSHPLIAGRLSSPRPVKHLCTARILIHEAVDGPSLEEHLIQRSKLSAAAGAKDPILHWIGSWFFLTLFGRLMPRDPDPKGVILDPGGRIALFGADHRKLERQDSDLLWRYLESVVDGDPEKACDVLVERIPELGSDAIRRQFRRLVDPSEASSGSGNPPLGAQLRQHHAFLTRHRPLLPEPLAGFYSAFDTLHQSLERFSPGRDVSREVLEVMIIRRHLRELRGRLQWSNLSDDLVRAVDLWSELPQDLDAFLNLRPATAAPSKIPYPGRAAHPATGDLQLLCALILSSVVFQLLVQVPPISAQADRLGFVVVLALGAAIWLKPAEGSRDHAG